jgi:allantoate deiminase
VAQALHGTSQSRPSAGVALLLQVERLRIADGERLVCTVGKFSIHPGATNVIPGAVNFTVDIRSK